MSIQKANGRVRAPRRKVGVEAAAGMGADLSSATKKPDSSSGSASTKATPTKARVDQKTVTEARQRFQNQVSSSTVSAIGLKPMEMPSMETLADVKKRAGDVVNTVADKVKDTVSNVKDRIVGGANDIKRDIDVATKETSVDDIRQLKEGDKITVGGSGEVTGKIHRVADAVGETEMKKTIEKQKDGTYKITVEQGGKLGAQVGDEVSVGGRQGGKLVNEYVVKTPEEAKKIFDEAGTVNGSNPTPGRAQEELKKQAESQKRLNDARTSTEIVSEGQIDVGLDVGSPMGPGVKTDGKGKSSTTMKVEYDETGRPKKLIVKMQTELESTTMPNIGVNADKGGATLSPEQGSKSKVTVSREIEIDIPPDMDPKRLVNDPQGVVRELKDGARIKPNKVEIEQVIGNSETKITLQNKDGKDINVPKLLGELGPSDPLMPRRSANDVMRDANVESVKVETFDKQGLDVKIGIDIGIGGIEVGGERTVRKKTNDETTPIPA